MRVVESDEVSANKGTLYPAYGGQNQQKAAEHHDSQTKMGKNHPESFPKSYPMILSLDPSEIPLSLAFESLSRTRCVRLMDAVSVPASTPPVPSTRYRVGS